MRVKLTSIDPWACQYDFAVEDLPATIGRAIDADVCVADQWVSRVHCELYDLNGSLAVRDLGSKHGTFVNGLRIQETLLLPGNRLSLGMTTLKVEYKRRAAKVSPPVESPCETVVEQGKTFSELHKLDTEENSQIGSLTPLPDRQAQR